MTVPAAPAAPDPQATPVVELADSFDDVSLEMNAAGKKFRVGDLTGKPGLLADPQTPLPHAATHRTGPDKLDVGGLSGLLADPQRLEIAKAGTLVGTRKRLNLIEGVNTTLTVADNPGADRVDVTVTSIMGAIADPVTGFAWAANAASIAVNTAHHFAATNTLTGNSTLTLTGGVDGCLGLILVKQDATGGRTLTFAVASRTVLKDLNVPDTSPLAVPNSITRYQYYYVTIAGTAYVIIDKGYLQ